MDVKDFGEDNVIEIEYTCGSDYSGDAVTRTNYEILLDELKDTIGVYDLQGYYSGYGIGYVESELTEEGKAKIADIEERLEDYPCLDEDALSEKEYAIKAEYWDSEAKYLLRPWLSDSEAVKDLDEGLIHEAQEIFENLCIIESGQLAYCNSERFYSDMVEKFPVKKVYCDGVYTVVKANRGSNALYLVNGTYIVARAYDMDILETSAKDIYALTVSGIIRVIEEDYANAV